MFNELIKPFRNKRILPLDSEQPENSEQENQQNKQIQEKVPPLKMHSHSNPHRKPVVKPVNWFVTVKRLWHYLSRHRLLFILVMMMVVLTAGLGLLAPILVGKAVDEYIVTKQTEGLIALLVALTLVYLIHATTSFLQNYWMIKISQNAVYTLRKDLFKQIHRLPIFYFDKRQHGEIMSRVTNDIENVSSTLNSSVIQISTSILMLVGTVSVMFWLSPLLTLVTLIIVPMMFLGMKWITSRTGKSFKAQQKHLGNLNGFIEETISGQTIVKTFSQEKKVIGEFLLKSEQLKMSGFWAQTISGFIPKLMHVLNNFSFAVIAGIGGVLAIKGAITIGVIVVFTEYSRQFTRPLNDLANQFNTLLSAVAGAERVFELLDEKAESAGEGDLHELTNVKGNVEYRNVSFSYEKEGDTIKDISFSARQGETVALVGPTGAGKTTIINLLARFYSFNEGEILLDGKDIRSIKRESLRGHLGVVLQDTILFEGTIKENIRFGHLDATDDEVEAAAIVANAHSFIMKLPDKYDTVLKQDGSGISQGQKQLLAIARAVLKDPAILILDEATSSIDTITEVKIQEALQKLMHGRTSFVIAHRLNTIKSADKIIVLNEGRLIEMGSHHELLANEGFYYGLYKSQLQNQTV